MAVDTATQERSTPPGTREASRALVAGDGRPVLVGPMKRRHLRGVLAIETATNPNPWSQNLFLGELKMPMSRIYNVAVDSHMVLGFCGLMLVADEGHITTIAVHPTARRLGLARYLLARTIREALSFGVTDLTLEVRAGNRGAQELYRRFGFAPGGIRPRYYSDNNEDALIMWANDVNTDEYSERLEAFDVR